MSELTVELARKTLFEIVMEVGADYRYQRPEAHDGCKNVHEGKPSCLIGRMIVALGVPVDWMEVNSPGDGVYSTLDKVVDGGFFDRRPEKAVYDYLAVVQNAQDEVDSAGRRAGGVSLHSWGYCLGRGDQLLRDRGLL